MISAKGCPSQITWASLPAKETSSKSPSGSTVIVPVVELLQGLPVVVTVKLYNVCAVTFAVGVPDISNWVPPPVTIKVTPVGKPVTVAPEAPSNNWYCIS